MTDASTINLNNINNIERVVRLFIGCSLIGSVMFLPAPFHYLILMPLIGIYPCLTAIVGWDPVYYVFGVNQERIGNFIENSLLPNSTADILRPRII